jgi:hypothetical protein
VLSARLSLTVSVSQASRKSLPLLPVELLIPIIEQLALDNDGSLEDKYLILRRIRMASKSLNSIVESARPLLFQDVRLDGNDLTDPTSLLKTLLERNAASVGALTLENGRGPCQTVDNVDPVLHSLLRNCPTTSFKTSILVAQQAGRALLKLCLEWPTLEHLDARTWHISGGGLAKLPLLKTLLVAGLSVTPRAMASTPPSFGLVKLVYGEGSRGLHPIASDQFRHFTLNSALTLTSLAVSLDNHFVELDLSHLKSLSVLSLHLPPTPSPSVNVSEELDVILSAIDTCGPSLQFLKISGSTRTYDTDLLEERNILN